MSKKIWKGKIWLGPLDLKGVSLFVDGTELTIVMRILVFKEKKSEKITDPSCWDKDAWGHLWQNRTFCSAQKNRHGCLLF